MNDLIYIGLTKEQIKDLITLLEYSDNENYTEIKEMLKKELKD